jgi:hypothetical protein
MMYLPEVVDGTLYRELITTGTFVGTCGKAMLLHVNNAIFI